MVYYSQSALKPSQPSPHRVMPLAPTGVFNKSIFVYALYDIAGISCAWNLCIQPIWSRTLLLLGRGNQHALQIIVHNSKGLEGHSSLNERLPETIVHNSEGLEGRSSLNERLPERSPAAAAKPVLESRGPGRKFDELLTTDWRRS